MPQPVAQGTAAIEATELQRVRRGGRPIRVTSSLRAARPDPSLPLSHFRRRRSSLKASSGRRIPRSGRFCRTRSVRRQIALPCPGPRPRQGAGGATQEGERPRAGDEGAWGWGGSEGDAGVILPLLPQGPVARLPTRGAGGCGAAIRSFRADRPDRWFAPG
jgi:hypothetical protein